MSTDRELLELAAKAANVTGKWCEFHHADSDYVAMGFGNPGYYAPGVKLWNPLTDDGDALRLAVKLDLTVRHYSGSTVAQSGAPGTPCAYEEVSNHTDPCAAARRAIVRAAAQIGKASA